MATELIELVEVTTYSVTLKFGLTLKTSSIVNSAFVVVAQTATPTTLANPFNIIDLETDYNSISRALTLYWADGALSANTAYELTVTDLKNAYGTILEDTAITFTTGDEVTVTEDDLPETQDPPVIVDHSIQQTVFTNLVINQANAPFKVDSIDPFDGDYYLPEDYNNGRIVIKFTDRPAYNFLAHPYIKVQKKAIQRSPSRWESIDFSISIDSTKPWVYIDLPSIDHYPETATPYAGDPVYYTDGYSYFSENYKYRILLSKDIST
jgi:hypothetical protein